MTHAVLLRGCLALLWIAILFAAVLFMSVPFMSDAAMAQAQPAPIPPSPGTPDIYSQGATMPDISTPGVIGSTTAPDWSQYMGQNGAWVPACSGIACLTPAQRQEIATLCGKAGADWAQYSVCLDLNARISQGLGP